MESLKVFYLKPMKHESNTRWLTKHKTEDTLEVEWKCPSWHMVVYVCYNLWQFSWMTTADCAVAINKAILQNAIPWCGVCFVLMQTSFIFHWQSTRVLLYPHHVVVGHVHMLYRVLSCQALHRKATQKLIRQGPMGISKWLVIHDPCTSGWERTAISSLGTACLYILYCFCLFHVAINPHLKFFLFPPPKFK